MGSQNGKDCRKLITVVIPNYNGISLIEKCLSSVYEGSWIPQVIVIDNASTDGSDKLVEEKFPDAVLLRLKANTGFCHAVNCGLHLTRTRFVMLLNNDATVDKDCIRYLYEALIQNESAFSVQARMLSMKDPSVLDDAGDFYSAMGWAFARGKAKPADTYMKPGKIFSACAGAAMYKTKIFGEIGYFDERHFCYLEDVDIGYRARIYGYQNLYEPRAVVEHFGSKSSGAVYSAFKEELVPGNNLYLIYKNMPAVQYAVNAPLIAAGKALKNRFFSQKGLGEAYNNGIQRGIYLRDRAKAAKWEADNGMPVTKASIAEESCPPNVQEELLGMNPLYLGGKVPFEFKNLPNYIGIQLDLWAGCISRLKQ